MWSDHNGVWGHGEMRRGRKMDGDDGELGTAQRREERTNRLFAMIKMNSKK